MEDGGLIDLLRQHVMPQRFGRMHAVSSQRTRYISLVLEDIHYTQNISAMLRTCDCLGIQDVYLIGDNTSTRINKHVSLGASNWVDVHRETRRPKKEVLAEIKERGYRLVATMLDDRAVSLPDFPIERGRCALILGNEMKGVSAVVQEMADDRITIPMYGFCDSYNVSVSAAIILYELVGRLRASEISWLLNREEQLELQYRWIKKSLKRGEEVAEAYELRLKHPNDQ